MKPPPRPAAMVWFAGALLIVGIAPRIASR